MNTESTQVFSENKQQFVLCDSQSLLTECKDIIAEKDRKKIKNYFGSYYSRNYYSHALFYFISQSKLIELFKNGTIEYSHIGSFIVESLIKIEYINLELIDVIIE